jgi:hypothetical protein
VATVQKSLVLEALRRRGLDARADWVDRAMPDDIDVRQNASLFDMLGIDAQTLAADEPANPKGAAS